MSSASETKLTGYLLGTLAPEDQAGLEERLFADDDLHEELQATADDLIHAYIVGTLTRDDRARFESHFLALPRHRQRLALLRDLLSAVERVSAGAGERGAARAEPSASRAFPSWATAAVIVLASAAAIVGLRLGGGGQWTPTVPAGRPSTGPTTVARATPAPGELPLARPTPGLGTESPAKPQREPVVRIPRQPGRHPLEVSLSPETRFVRLEVPLESDGSPSYDAVLRTARAVEVWKAENLEPAASGGRLVLAVPAWLLTTGDYTLLVRGEQLRESQAPVAPLEVKLRFVRSR